MIVGDLVIVINTESLPRSFLGRYGIVTNVFEEKVMVQFEKSVGNVGGLSHTAKPSDLERVAHIQPTERG